MTQKSSSLPVAAILNRCQEHAWSLLACPACPSILCLRSFLLATCLESAWIFLACFFLSSCLLAWCFGGRLIDCSAGDQVICVGTVCLSQDKEHESDVEGNVSLYC
jgi:hypothetical protein